MHIEPLIDDEIQFASQNVFDEINSKTEVLEYLADKMSAIDNSPNAQVYAELSETTQYPMYTVPEQPCVIMAQGSKDNILAVALFQANDAKITRIDICSAAPAPEKVVRSGRYPS